MALHMNDDSMSLEINGATVEAAVRLDNLWRVTGWPRLLTRNEAITSPGARRATARRIRR